MMDINAAPQDEELERLMNNKALQQLMQAGGDVGAAGGDVGEAGLGQGADEPLSEDPIRKTLPFEPPGEMLPIPEEPMYKIPFEPPTEGLPVSPMPEVPSGKGGMWDTPLAAGKIGAQLPSGMAGLIRGRVPPGLPKLGQLPMPPGLGAGLGAIKKLPTPPSITKLPGSKAITTPLSKLPGAGALRKIPGLGKLFGRR